MSTELPPYEKFYRCVRIIIQAWKSKDGYEYDADLAMGKIDDLVAEGKFLWNEDKIAEELADYIALDKETVIVQANDDKKAHELSSLFPKRMSLFAQLFFVAILVILILFLTKYFSH